MLSQEGFQLLRTPSPDEAGLESDLLQGHASSTPKTDILYPDSEFRYPGGAGNVAFSTTLFTTLYEEEELCELHYWSKDFSKPASVSETPCEESGLSTRPTIYHVLRLFDSIRGFHRVRSFSYHKRCQSEKNDSGLS